MKTLTLVRRVGVALVLAITIVLLLPRGVTTAAGGFSIDTRVNYKVSGTITTVTEDYTVTDETPREFLTQITLSTPVDTVTGVQAAYSDGTNIPVTATKQSTTHNGLAYDYRSLALKFPKQIYGQGKTWSFSVSYIATGLAEAHGGAHTVYVPSIQPSDMQGAYDVRVDVPADFGTPHLQGAKSSRVSAGGGRQFFDFTKTEILAHSLALSFGNQSTYQVNFNFPLVNNGFIPRTEQITLPPNLNNQHIHIVSLDPKPLNTHVDADGNILADYRVAPGQHMTVKTVVDGEVNYLDYNLAASGKASAIPANLVSAYTSPTQYWQTGGRVGAVAKSLTDPNKPVIQNVQAMYQYVIDHLTYNPNKIKFNVRQGAAKALANPSNVVCLEYSDLLIAMLRSQGIPARMPIGYGYSGNLKASASVADSLHSWVEAYVPGIGWMTLDPTWGEKFDLFGQSDLDHFAFAVWGAHDQSPAATTTNARDDGYQYEQATLGYIGATQTVPAGAKLSITRRAILPGISLDQAQVSAASDAPGQYTWQQNGKNQNLGVLAPGQHVTLYHWVLGGGWIGSGQAALIQTTDTQSLILARTSIKVDYRALGLILLLAILGLSWRIMLRLRLHFPGKRKEEIDYE